MAITASEVNKLRQQTGAGMMDCKNALVESNGDFETAVDVLRKKGQKIAAKRGENDAKEGIIIAQSTEDSKAGVIVTLNCETDFVAKSEEFKESAKQIAMHIAAMKPNYLNIEDIPETKLNEEKDIIVKQSENEGKPPEVIEKIVEGRIISFYKDSVLNEQIFCNPEIYDGKVSTMIEEMSGKLGEKIFIKQFSRVEVGS